MDVLSEFMQQIDILKKEAEEKRVARLNKAEEVFLSAKDELIAKIDSIALSYGEVILRKQVELPNGPDSIDYEHLTKLCHDNCITVDWSTHMGASDRLFIFKLDLRKVESVLEERTIQAKLELK